MQRIQQSPKIVHAPVGVFLCDPALLTRILMRIDLTPACASRSALTMTSMAFWYGT
jgi:hypothetical protein